MSAQALPSLSAKCWKYLSLMPLAVDIAATEDVHHQEFWQVEHPKLLL